MKITKAIHHGKTRWQAQWFDRGKRNRRFFDSREAARNFVDRWELERTAVGSEWAGVRRSERAEMFTAWERAKQKGYSLLHACEAFERDPTNLVLAKVPLKKALYEFLDSKRAQNLKRFTIELMEASLLRLVARFPEEPVSGITFTDLERYLKARGGTPKSRKNWIGELSGFFGWCVSRGYPAKNPAESLAVPIITRGTPKIMTVDQCSRLLEECRSCDPELLAVVAICLFGGTGEAQQLEWNAVDLKSGIVTVGENIAKGHGRRIIPITDNCAQWLGLGGVLPIDRVDDRIGAVRKGAKILEWPRNFMQHNFCPSHLALHESPAKTALIAGNSETMLFRHYRDLVSPDQAKAFFEICPG